jgi:hypothetical protein
MELPANLVLDILVINRRFGIDADRCQLFKDAVKAIVLRSCGAPRFAITTPENCNFMRFPVGHYRLLDHLAGVRVQPALGGRSWAGEPHAECRQQTVPLPCRTRCEVQERKRGLS